MSRRDVLVVGGGISGASLAFHAARSGRKVLLVEKSAKVGGCMQSVQTESGYWFELGAHTCYNSYGALLELIESSGQLDKLVPRGKPVLKFLDKGRTIPGKNLGLLVKLFNKLELMAAVPKWFLPKPKGLSVREYYSRLVGRGNYERVLGAMLSAVPSQPADDFPSDMLFKKRERRKDIMRSFTVAGGLGTIIERLVEHENIEVRTDSSASRVQRVSSGYQVELSDGSTVEADQLALAVPPPVAVGLLAGAYPELSNQVSKIGAVEVESLGFAVSADKPVLPYATFFIPLADSFYSAVTRDVVADPERRAFTFHFRPSTSREERLSRVQEVVGIELADMQDLHERRAALPSPEVGHAALIEEVDAQLAGQPLAISGNWFAGLSIEDCALRSWSEWARLSK